MALVRPLPHTKTKTVELDGRKFIVRFQDETPVQIVERKNSKPKFGVTYAHNQTYWSAKHHARGSRETIVSKVLDAASATP